MFGRKTTLERDAEERLVDMPELRAYHQELRQCTSLNELIEFANKQIHRLAVLVASDPNCPERKTLKRARKQYAMSAYSAAATTASTGIARFNGSWEIKRALRP